MNETVTRHEFEELKAAFEKLRKDFLAVKQHLQKERLLPPEHGSAYYQHLGRRNLK